MSPWSVVESNNTEIFMCDITYMRVDMHPRARTYLYSHKQDTCTYAMQKESLMHAKIQKIHGCINVSMRTC